MQITVKPANEAPFEDIQTIFHAGGDANWCQCQWFRLSNTDMKGTTTDDRRALLEEQTRHGDGRSIGTTGLVAYVDGEPAGWCGVEPRVNYVRLLRSRRVWPGRDEDKTDPRVWSIICFVTRKEFRRLGVAGELAVAAREHARRAGATAVEGYPIDTAVRGSKTRANDLFVGSAGVFAAAGFREVSRPTPDRVVMRVDF